MNILVVQETDWIERNPILHHRMLEALSLEGHQVTVLDFDILWRLKGRGPVWQSRQVFDDCHKFFPDARVRVIRSPMLRVPGFGRLSWLLFNSMELRALLRDQRPDVIVAYSITNAYVALKLAKSHGIPFVYHVLDALHTLAEPACLRPLARAVEREVMRGADRVVVVNNALRDYAAALGASPATISIIPMGATRTQASEAVRTRVRTSLGFGEQDTVLLFMGWLYRFSGLRELVRALARRGDEISHLKLLIVGDGDLYAELCRMRDDLGLENTICLTGRRPREEMQGYIAACDFGLLPAERNATMQHIVPAKVLEYMEAGRAVIATRLAGLEAEFHDVQGVLYAETPEDTIAIALHRADEAQALGRSCSAFMQGRADWDTVTAEFRAVLDLGIGCATGNAPARGSV